MKNPLPAHLQHRPFGRQEALDAGVLDGRLRSRTLTRPFHGVRAHEHATSLWALVDAYAQRMPPSQHFSHVTAALIHGFPLHAAVASVPHVSAPPTAGFPRARGVTGHHSDSPVVHVRGLRVSHPVATWCDLATVLSLDDLVAAGDFLITGDEPFSGIPPLSCLEELRGAVRARAGRRGARRLAEALSLVRYGPLSRMETLSRLIIVRDRLPEPSLNFHARNTDGEFVAMVDLAFEQWKVAVEYQGDHHREKQRFRDDITRRERLEDARWSVVCVSADDILRRPQETLARIRRRLRERGAAL